MLKFFSNFTKKKFFENTFWVTLVSNFSNSFGNHNLRESLTWKFSFISDKNNNRPHNKFAIFFLEFHCCQQALICSRVSKRNRNFDN